MTTRRDDWLDFWERRERAVLTVLPYVLLALCAAADAVIADAGWTVDLGLAAAAAAVMASIDLRDRRSAWTEPQTVLGPVGATLTSARASGKEVVSVPEARPPRDS